jgi:hypothetical protein
MSILLVYVEIPNLRPDIRLPSEFAAFTTNVTVRDEPDVNTGLVITDGVASDRFLAFGRGTRAKDGAKLRTALLAFIKTRLADGARVFLWFNVFESQVDNVALDFQSVQVCSLSQLRRVLKTLELSRVLEVVS